jgi:hypothetical protein
VPHHKFLEAERLLRLSLSIVAQFLLKHKVNCVLLCFSRVEFFRTKTDVDGPAGTITRVCHLDYIPIFVTSLHQFQIQLVEQVMGFCFTNCISLTNTVKFFKQHALQWLRSEVEKNGPCLCNCLLIDINKVKLIDVAIDEQMFVLSVHLGKLFVPVLQVLKVFLVLWLRSLAIIALTSALLWQTWSLSVTAHFFFFLLVIYYFRAIDVVDMTIFVIFEIR